MNADEALLQLLAELKPRHYRFTTVTPATHARILARPHDGAVTLRDIFGWNRPFEEQGLELALLELLRAASVIEKENGQLRSKVRVASIGDQLFLHSAFPTTESDAVFFGPDTLRFVRFVSEKLPNLGPRDWVVDHGAGSGAGAIAVASLLPGARITLTDVNAAALRFARLNARAAGVTVETRETDQIPDGPNLVIANPPYMIDAQHRAYRDGGGLLGGEIALRWTEQALSALRPGGVLLLYTGAAATDGALPLVDALAKACDGRATLEFEELDPDVFGEELDSAAYRDVERIAVIGATITKN